MARICCLNNYPIEKMWQLAATGAIPRQHAWGVDALAAAGHRLDFAPFREPAERNLLDRLSARTKHVLGHLDQEAYVLRHIRGTDVIYSADQSGLAGLALARSILPARKMISVVHHPVRLSPRLAAAARNDVLICLSTLLQSQLERDLPRRRAKIVQLPWGPDLDCALYRPRGESHGVVSTGKSNRDLSTLAVALHRTGAPALLYDLERRLPATPSQSVRLVHPGSGEGVDPDSPSGYLASKVIADTAAAAIVAIPVIEPQRLTGLTEAADALALGKPILATRSPYFPFDIEAIGCGIWIDPGDVDGWTNAIAALMAEPSRRRALGEAGRRFAEREWNYAAFCAGVCGLVTS